MRSTDQRESKDTEHLILAHGGSEVWDREAASTYVASALSFGALGSAIREQALSSARWYTLLRAQPATDFEIGGYHFDKRSEGPGVRAVSHDDDRLAELIASYLTKSDSFCAMENPIARAGDAFLSHLQSVLRFCGDTVVHWLSTDEPYEAVRVALREAKHTPFCLGVMGRSQSLLLDIAGTDQITQATAVQIARAAELVFVAAYDGESYLVAQLTSRTA